MAEAEKGGEDTSVRGTDWEVVSLTASAFAAAPGPKGFDQPDIHKDAEVNKSEQASSGAMFMSGHFISPHSGHENHPTGPEYNEIYSDSRGKDVSSVVAVEDDLPTKTNVDNRNIEVVDALVETQLYEKGSSLSHQNIEYGEGKALQGLTSVEQEQIIYHAGSDVNESVLCDETIALTEQVDTCHQNANFDENYSSSSKPNDENRHDESRLPPCKSWWKKQAVSLYSHVKETNTFWPVFVAAAVMGLVILGQRWRKEKLQLQHLKLQSGINKEGVKQMAGPIDRLKYVFGSNHEQNPFIRGGPSSNNLGF